MQPHICNVGIAQCTPIPMVQGANGKKRLALITIEWHRAERNLARPTNINTIQVFRDGMEVGEARQSAVEECMKLPNRPEFIFFLDYDVIPQYDALTKLLYRARHFPDYDVIAGVYCLKSSVPEPLVYKEWGEGPFWDWSVGDLLTDGITGVHMGCTLIRMSLFDRLDYQSKPAFLTECYHYVKDGGIHQNRGTEDLYFCKRAIEEAGAKILVDTSVLCGHQEISSGQIFGLPADSRPVKGAKWLACSDEYKQEKKALDLGAGDRVRQWDGYKTYRTDIRADTNPDYVQDTRHLNLPFEHFDLIASSHHLEHIPRWEQETVWKQMFQICKAGGRIEHIVPSLDWAGMKLANGETDEHVMNVLYGAQEAMGYERGFNTHYFGYTKAIAVALAEGAGFVDVKCEDWRDDEGLFYHMKITGRKPPVEAPAEAPEATSDDPAVDVVAPEKLRGEPTDFEAADDFDPAGALLQFV